MLCLWQLWMLCLARISGLKEAGCHCVPHGTSKQCLNYSDESAGFSVEGLKQARRNRRQETHLNLLEQVITWVQRRFFVDQGLGSPSAEVPSGRLCGWILSKWKHHVWRIAWHWRCGRFGFGTSPLPYLSCNVDWQREIKKQIKEYQRDISWHIFLHILHKIYLIYYINHVFFPKKWQNFMVRYLRGATARVARVAASEARPLLLLTRNDSLEPIHKGLWGFARTVRLEELSVVIFFMWSTSNSGCVSFCRCESVNLFFRKIFWASIFPIIVSSFLWKWTGVTVSCWLWGVLSLSRCAMCCCIQVEDWRNPMFELRA